MTIKGLTTETLINYIIWQELHKGITCQTTSTITLDVWFLFQFLPLCKNQNKTKKHQPRNAFMLFQFLRLDSGGKSHFCSATVKCKYWLRRHKGELVLLFQCSLLYLFFWDCGTRGSRMGSWSVC